MGTKKEYTLKYHRLVLGEISGLDSFWRGQVLTSIEDKLLTYPESFGKPLRQSLRSCRGLRVGDYRVVFQIQQKNVFIVAIIHRSSKYKGLEKRI